MGSNPIPDKKTFEQQHLFFLLFQGPDNNKKRLVLTPHVRGYSSVVEHPAAVRQVLGSTPSVPFSFAPIHYLTHHNKKHGPNGDLNPGPPAPKAGIIPQDH